MSYHFRVESVLASLHSSAFTLTPVEYWHESPTEKVTEERDGVTATWRAWVPCEPGDPGAEPDSPISMVKKSELRISDNIPDLIPGDYITLEIKVDSLMDR